MCKNKDACHVTKCEECDIPEPWREEFRQPKSDLVSRPEFDMFATRRKQKTYEDYMWNVEEKENEEGGIYVKLDIVEGYTGY